MRHSLIASALILISGFINAADLCDEIAEAFKTGNTAVISKYFAKTLDMTIAGSLPEDMYPKAKAEQALKDFFTKNPAKGFTVIHKGSSKEGTRFYIGTLNAGTGSFRVHFILRNSEGKDFIEELRIEKQ